MFLRRHRKHAAGETCEYWTLCESRRTAAGPRQHVLPTRSRIVEDLPIAAQENVVQKTDA